MHTFDSAIGPIHWNATDALLTIEIAGRIHLLPWEDIRGAGIVLLPQGSAATAPIGRHLVIAPARENFLLRIPLEDRGLESRGLGDRGLEETVRAQLGERFHTNLTPDSYRKTLIPPWANLPEWVMPAAVLGFIGVSAIFLLLMILIAMPQGAGWSIVWWQVGMGLLVWLLIVAGILGVYRRIWMK